MNVFLGLQFESYQMSLEVRSVCRNGEWQFWCPFQLLVTRTELWTDVLSWCRCHRPERKNCCFCDEILSRTPSNHSTKHLLLNIWLEGTWWMWMMLLLSKKEVIRELLYYSCWSRFCVVSSETHVLLDGMKWTQTSIAIVSFFPFITERSENKHCTHFAHVQVFLNNFVCTVAASTPKCMFIIFLNERRSLLRKLRIFSIQMLGSCKLSHKRCEVFISFRSVFV